MRARPIPLLRPMFLSSVALMLGACSVKTHGDNGTDASITIGNGADAGGSGGNRQSVAIDVPGFSAKVNVPDLDIGGDTRIEDMPLFPGTKVNGVNISARGGDDSDEESKGDVTMAFTAPGDAAKIVGWYKDQAARHGWQAVPPMGGNQFEAIKQGDDGKAPTHFALQVQPATGGSSGRFIVTGH